MKPKNKSNVFFLLLFCSLAFGQLDTYTYKRELTKISGQWHKIELPDAIFGQISTDLSDIRIYGVTAKDTLEAPYLFRVASEKYSKKEVDFRLMNSTSNHNGYYYTYKIPTTEPINKIQLDFKNTNFDWHITLEASQNQVEWFTILEDYRILSIKNAQTDYEFTDLNFPDSKYQYYRLLVRSSTKPELQAAKISLDSKIDAQYRNCPITDMDISEDKENKQTHITIDLKQRLPLSFLKIDVTDAFDYYRPFSIHFVSDSIQTEKGWKYQYSKLHSGTLNSIEKNQFEFKSTLAKKLKVIIQNRDNQPLKIKGAEAKGYIHELVARFTEPATYFLTYGNSIARKPQYDISQSVSKIPKDLPKLSLGDEQQIPKKQKQTISPLFENKLWLWGVMGIVILVLGWFTLKMMLKR